MTNPFNDEAARLAALDLFPGREWEDLTEGEQEKAWQSVTELRRILDSVVGTSGVDYYGMLHGQKWARTNADGSVTMIDPQDIYIAQDEPNEGH